MTGRFVKSVAYSCAHAGFGHEFGIDGFDVVLIEGAKMGKEIVGIFFHVATGV